jgi:uncharacterized protein
VIHLHTSAFVKLVQGDRETPALQGFLTGHPETTLVSSALLVVETRRAILRQAADQLARADLLLTRIDQVDITRALLEAASRLASAARRQQLPVVTP